MCWSPAPNARTTRTPAPLERPRGGKPMSDQSRATAWHVLRWAEALYIENILIENVKEFRSWGPLGASGRPIKRLRGELYLQFINSLKALGYRVEDRVLNAADYGDPTTRERLFLIARRGNRPIVWPAATHASASKLRKAKGQGQIFARSEEALKPWRTAREIIDWSIPAKSIFERKRPLAPKTIARIAAGIRKFCGEYAEPFLVMLYGTNTARSLDKPLPTVTAEGTHAALVQPFLIGQQSCAAPRSVEDPVPTVATAGAISMVEPFVTMLYGKSKVRSVDEPVPTVTAGPGHVAVVEPFVEPFILPMEGVRRGNRPRSLDEPLNTVTASRGAGYLVEPFILPQFSEHAPKSVDAPLGTITTTSRGVGLCEPFIVGAGGPSGAGKPRGVDAPLKTVLTKNSAALVEPFMLNIDHQTHGDSVRSVDSPVPTVTTKARTCLVEPFMVPFFGEREGQGPRCHSVDEPMPAVTGHGAGALIEPFVMHLNRPEDAARAVSEPMQTVTAQSADFGLIEPSVEPFLLTVNHGDEPGEKNPAERRSSSIHEPMPTVTTNRGQGLVQPFVVKYNGTAKAQSVEEPLDTVSTRDRFGLIETEAGTFRLDIRFRMLEPHELAAAQGLAGYKFTGKKTDVVKQIGNAVPKGLATSLCSELIV